MIFSYQNKEIEIDGLRFELMTLPAGEGLALRPKVNKVLKEQADEADLLLVHKTFAKRCKVKTDTGWAELGPIFDSVFTAKYDVLMKWMMFCVEANYGSFLANQQNIVDFAEQLLGNKDKS